MAKVGLITRLTKSANAVLYYVTGTDVSGDKRALDVYSQGGEILDVSGLMDGAAYDYIAFAYPDSDTDTLTFKTGGSGGTTVATVTINYTDATKENISNIART